MKAHSREQSRAGVTRKITRSTTLPTQYKLARHRHRANTTAQTAVKPTGRAAGSESRQPPFHSPSLTEIVMNQRIASTLGYIGSVAAARPVQPS